MHTYFSKKLDFIFTLCVSLLLLTSVISFITFQKSASLATSIHKRQMVIRQLELLLSNVKDAEAGVRSFAHTNDPFFLTPYVGMHEKVILALDNLFTEIKARPTQKLDLLRLEAVVNRKFETLEQWLTFLKINTSVPASVLSAGNANTDQMLKLIAKMVDHETRQTTIETSEWKKLGYVIYALNSIIFILSIVIAFHVWNRLKIGRNKREELQKNLDEKEHLSNQQLELIEGITETIAQGNYQLKLRAEEKLALGNLAGKVGGMIRALENSFDNLNDSIKKKDKFLNIAAHEFKTPLTIIKSSLEIISKLEIKGKEGEVLHLFNAKALAQINHLTKMVKDLLDVSRINEGRLELKLENFSLEEVILESSGKDVCPKPEIQFVEQLKPTVYADRIKVKEVLTHFISNARKYSSQEKGVSIEVKTESEHVKVAVKDQGIGIPKEKLPFIFEKYFRADDTNKNFSGFGLGLFISKGIIEAHHGRVGAEHNEAKGSTFWFTLPLNSRSGQTGRRFEAFNKPPQLSPAIL